MFSNPRDSFRLVHLDPRVFGNLRIALRSRLDYTILYATNELHTVRAADLPVVDEHVPMPEHVAKERVSLESFKLRFAY